LSGFSRELSAVGDVLSAGCDNTDCMMMAVSNESL
jgi:hypothetical protein